MFDGFRSRWMIPCWCRCSTARATVATSRTAVGTSTGPWAIRCGQALAVDVLHGEEILAVELAHLVDVDDVRMAQAGRPPSPRPGSGGPTRPRPDGWPGSSSRPPSGRAPSAAPRRPRPCRRGRSRGSTRRGRNPAASRARCRPVATSTIVFRRRGQLLQCFQAIQRRGQLGMLPQQRLPIRLLARLKPGEIRVEHVQASSCENQP